jgi:hypothetical protein
VGSGAVELGGPLLAIGRAEGKAGRRVARFGLPGRPGVRARGGVGGFLC